MSDNLISRPPLTIAIVDPGGNTNKAWAIFFRDIYARIGYKGGTILDDTNETIDETIDTLEEVIAQVEINTTDIAINIVDIDENKDNIGSTGEGQSDINHRVFGDDQPDGYKDSGKAYLIGDCIYHPVTVGGAQKYYCAREDVADPAGVFDPAKWQEKNVKDSLSVSESSILLPTKAFHVEFSGRGTDGAATLAHSFNIASITRSGAGTYNGIISQETFHGVGVLTGANIFVNSIIAASVNSPLFDVDAWVTGATTFTVRVYEVTVSGPPVRTLYDPTGSDFISLTGLTDLSGGILPPA